MVNKMKKMIYVLVISFLSLTIVSCAKKSDTSSTSTTNTEIEGTWKTACHSSGDYYYIRTVAVTGTTFVEKNEYHSDSSCANDNATFEVTFGSLTIGDVKTFDSYGSSGGSGAEFTMTLSANTLTLQNAQEVSLGNVNSYCGDSDWALDTPKSIVGKTCDLLNTGSSTNYWSSGTAIYGIYLLDGDKLFWVYSNSSYPDSVSTGDNDTFTKQ